MTQINWGLSDPNAYQRGYEQSKGVFDDMAKTRKQNALEAAMRQYALNPDDPNAINALAVIDAPTAMKLRQQSIENRRYEQKAKAETAEDYRKDILTGAQIVRQMQPSDQATWDQTLSAAAAAGVDTTKVPRQFDPQYAKGLIATADALEPLKQSSAESSPYQAVAGQPGAGVYRFNRATGTMDVLVQPNDGTAPVGARAPTPDSTAAIPSVTDQATYDAVPAGQEYRDPTGKVRIKPGGQTASPSGGFR